MMVRLLAAVLVDPLNDLLAPLRLRLVDSKAFTDGTAIWVSEPVRNQ
jgi:hypothetical protein